MLLAVDDLIYLRHFERQILKAQIELRRAVFMENDAVLPRRGDPYFLVVLRTRENPVELQNTPVRRVKPQVHIVVNITQRDLGVQIR